MPPPVEPVRFNTASAAKRRHWKVAKPFVNLTAITRSESLVAKSVPSVTSSRTRQSSMAVPGQRRPCQAYLPSHTQNWDTKIRQNVHNEEKNWTGWQDRSVRIACPDTALSTVPPDDAQSILSRPIPRNETHRRCILLTRDQPQVRFGRFVLEPPTRSVPRTRQRRDLSKGLQRIDRDVSVTPFVAQRASEGPSP